MGRADTNRTERGSQLPPQAFTRRASEPKVASRTRALRTVATGKGSWLSDKRPVLLFVLICAVLTGGLYLAITAFVGTDLHQAYLRLNAGTCRLVLHALGTEATTAGPEIRSARFSMQVVRGCDALDPAALLVAAMVAFPSSWLAKLVGVLAGVATVLVVNVVRMVSLFYIGLHFPRVFDVVHVEVWPTAIMLLALFVFLVWVRYATRPQVRRGAAES